MNYQMQLQYTMDLFKEMNISTSIIPSPTINIPSTIDLRLREQLYNKENYVDLLHNSMKQAQTNTIYCFYDEYDCKYIFMQLPNIEETYFFIGPYLLHPMTYEHAYKKIESIGLPAEKISLLDSFYSQLPIIENENVLFAIVKTLGNTLWDEYSLEYIEYMIPDFIDPIIIKSSSITQDSKFTLEAIEHNYENERILMDAISQGKLQLISQIASTVYTQGTEQRLMDTLRNRKNYLIILNTLLRKAAEYGSVHPFHIHLLSSSFARKIENIYSINESLKLQEDMMKDYCLLVKNHSLKNYSLLIGRIITIIDYDISQELTLHTLAKKVNINPCYLSTLFKKECGCTLTDYIRKKRLEKALLLLETTNKQIQSIAYECGIQDTNYFIKLFKKEIQMTPSQYRQFKNIN